MSSSTTCPAPVCPACKPHETCTYILQSANKCSVGVCQSDSPSKSNTGAIAGGVVGGIVGFLVLASVALWFYYKKRRSNDRGLLDDDNSSDLSPFEKRGYRPSIAASITTVNTNQARESNVIPVAYIPGVSVLPPVNERASSAPTIRNSIATTNYRASVPEMVMAVQGQPSLIQVTSDAARSNSTVNSTRLPLPPISRQLSSSSNGSQQSQRTAPNPPVQRQEGDTIASMVTIPEDAETHISPVPRIQPPPSRQGSTRNSSRRSSTWRSSERMSTVSRASSNGEYLLQLPEEAYLYHGGGFDTAGNRATLSDVVDRNGESDLGPHPPAE